MKQVKTCPHCDSQNVTVGEPEDRFLQSANPERWNPISIIEVRVSCRDCGFSGTTAVNNASEQHFISAN